MMCKGERKKNKLAVYPRSRTTRVRKKRAEFTSPETQPSAPPKGLPSTSVLFTVCGEKEKQFRGFGVSHVAAVAVTQLQCDHLSCAYQTLRNCSLKSSEDNRLISLLLNWSCNALQRSKTNSNTLPFLLLSFPFLPPTSL